MPSTPYDAKGLLIASVEEDNPVIFFEHRWLHDIYGDVPEEYYRVPLGSAKIVHEGSDVTIVASSHMTLEAWRAAQILREEGISVEVVDLRTIRPLDTETIFASVRKTGRVIVADPDWKMCGFAAEVVSLIVEAEWEALRLPPVRMTYPDALIPTSWSLSNHYYPGSQEMVVEVLKMMGRKTSARALLETLLAGKMKTPQDVPDKTFTGPF